MIWFTFTITRQGSDTYDLLQYGFDYTEIKAGGREITPASDRPLSINFDGN